MRILVLASDLYTRGGIARQTYTLASALGDLLGPENVDVLALLAYGDPSDVHPRFCVLGPVTDQLTAAAKVQFAMKALALARNRYDLVVCSIVAVAPVAAAIHFLHGTPFWVVCHGSEVWGPLVPYKRFALRQADRVLSVSRFTAERICEVHKIPRERVSILHNAIPDDFEKLLPAHDAEGSWETRATYPERTLLSVGSLNRIHAYKGFDTVIRALPLALKRFPNLRYVIVGDGDDRSRLEKLAAEHQLERYVTFAGSVSDEQMAGYYRSCDVFVLPSRTRERNGGWEGEGFGRVYVEAALAGKPVVGSRGGGAAEAVVHGKTGILVDPTSVEETSRAIIELLENPAAATHMGREGSRWAKQYFTEDALRRSLGGLLYDCKLGGQR
jgi:glycosyltransferase involved in cell wall biosynthesis